MEQFNKISHDIDIMGGKACIKGTRVTVGMIITQISDGKTINELLDEYPYLSSDDIMQALKYESRRKTPVTRNKGSLMVINSNSPRATLFCERG